MGIVIDTSVIVAVITNEAYKNRLMEITKNTILITPLSLHWEMGNAFSAMLRRDRTILEQAKVALNAYKKIPIKFYDIRLGSALELSKKYNLYAYDVFFSFAQKI
jgi:predicted nucleic acid-binding protein